MIILKHIFSTKNYSSILIIRVLIGIIFMAHGSQKLFGAFGGDGLEGTTKLMHNLGLEPAILMALMSGSAEFFGGLFVIVGLLTRPTSLVLASTMLVAILSVHINNGFFIQNNGFEYALTLTIIPLYIFLHGAGKISLDHIIFTKLSRKNK